MRRSLTWPQQPSCGELSQRSAVAVTAWGLLGGPRSFYLRIVEDVGTRWGTLASRHRYAWYWVSLGTLLFGLLGACSSSKSGADQGGCRSYCSDLCGTFSTCGGPPSGCESQCQSGFGQVDCSRARPPDQLTCSELYESYACIDYCATLCQRGPTCGSFDASLCATGCMIEGPPICNAASVAPRTCDQLKPELRSYQDTAQVIADGGEVIGGGSGTGAVYGLCRTGQDCQAPLGCSPLTNTCAPCATDTDCQRTSGTYSCSPDGACVEAACTRDLDCPLGVCDVTRHECIECRSNTDCRGLLTVCQVATSTCVECDTDVTCTRPDAKRCDPVSHRCAECLNNFDCLSASQPRCEPTTKSCGPCQSNADCSAMPGKPVCSGLHCVECLFDADCKDATKPGCNGLSLTCVACTKDEHCPQPGTCNTASNTCQ